VLDDRWRGRDPKSGRVALKLDNVQPWEIVPRLVLLTLLGWTGIGGTGWSPVPIVLNEHYRKKAESQKPDRRSQLTRLLLHRVLPGLQVYRVPCIKHILMILTTVARFVVSLPFALENPRRSLNMIDFAIVSYTFSSIVHELRQLRRVYEKGGSVYEYYEDSFNRFDSLFIVVTLVGLVQRAVGAIFLVCSSDGSSSSTANLSAVATNGSAAGIDLSAASALGDGTCGTSDLTDPYTYAFRLTMVFYVDPDPGSQRARPTHCTPHALYAPRTARARLPA
jgi:hypothetical protein